jgi:DNA-binding Lrp family transcriptional regulator
MPRATLDRTDARLLLALQAEPRATTMRLAELLGLSRNTVQARLAALERHDTRAALNRGANLEALGYPLTVFIFTRVRQDMLGPVGDDLARIPEVIEVVGVSGEVDLLVRVAAADADDLYRIAGMVLAIGGVERTTTALAMRDLVPYRIAPLLERIAGT